VPVTPQEVETRLGGSLSGVPLVFVDSQPHSDLTDPMKSALPLRERGRADGLL